MQVRNEARSTRSRLAILCLVLLGSASALPAAGTSDRVGVPEDQVAGDGDAWTAGVCPSLTYLYVASWSPGRIRTYCVNNLTGALTFLRFDPGLGDARDLAVSPDNQTLYYASSVLGTYRIAAADGTLTLVDNVGVGGGNFDDIALSLTGASIYATHASGKLHVFNVPAGGTPVPIQAINGLVGPHGVALHPSGRFLYVANQFTILGGLPGTQEIGVFNVNPDEGVNAGSYRFTAWRAKPDYFAPHPSGNFIYQTQLPGLAVTVGRIDGSGNVTPVGSPVLSGNGASQLVMNAAGTVLYVVNTNANNLTVFQIAGGTGGLTPSQVIATGKRPRHLILHPTAPFLYVVNAGDSSSLASISIYSINGAGALTLAGTVGLPNRSGYRLAIADLN